jgi:two-component system, chemotaxis family, protein-glutamate methylesterase/glutaminase
MTPPIRILIVDDSAFVRYNLSRGLETDPELKVVGSVQNGVEALRNMEKLKPDVVILDVEMPEMDGLTTLKRIMAEYPTPVIMFSGLTQQGARTTVQALMRGAFDFVPKPVDKFGLSTVIEALKSKVKAAKTGQLVTLQSHQTSPLLSPSKSGPQSFRSGDSLVVVGASTGGPRALQQLLSALPAELAAAILITQHMPPGFTRSLAQRLNEISPLRVQEAASGDRLARGLVLLAPGDFHLTVTKIGQVRLDQSPRRHHVRPAADVTMESAAQHYGSAVIGMILTGMGTDGAEGAAQIKAAGGKVIAEHESSSVVYGMPRSVVEAGLADRVVPLSAMASTLLNLIQQR